MAFSMAMFLGLDWFRTARARHTPAFGVANPCQLRDPLLHHVFKPNCSTPHPWGNDRYTFYTNSLGFRDEKIRDVPPTDTRPRILILGDSFTEGVTSWPNTYVGKIAAHFPQYDFLNAGQAGYSPSNHLAIARMLLAKGLDFDEVIVFLDNSAVQYEAAYYLDNDNPDVVVSIRKEQMHSAASWYDRLRAWVGAHLAVTARVLPLLDRLQQRLVARGIYYLPGDYFGDPFDREMSAWTYRKVSESEPFPGGYAPLGVEGGIAKEKAKMTLLWQELEKRHIPISVVIYPHLAQLVHDTPDSRQVLIFRQWCEGKCKRFISLFPAFFALKEQCPRLQPGCWYARNFVVGDFHFNAAGNAVVADAVIQSLTEEPPVKRAP
jgi:hypothetical protein